MKPRAEDTDARKIADIRLATMRLLLDVIDGIEAEYSREMERISERYEKEVTPYKKKLEEEHGELIRLIKENKAEFFREADVITLTNGALIHSRELKVSIPRDALGKCEELGFHDVVKIAKSLDRGAVEKWPDERLILIGAERKTVEKFSYEVKKEKQ